MGWGWESLAVQEHTANGISKSRQLHHKRHTRVCKETSRHLGLEDPLGSLLQAFCSHLSSPDLQPTKPTFNGPVLLILPPISLWNSFTALSHL